MSFLLVHVELNLTELDADSIVIGLSMFRCFGQFVLGISFRPGIAPRQFSRSAHLKMLLERTWHLSAPRDRTRSAQVNRAGFGAWRILQSERVGFPRSNHTLARGCAAGEKNAAVFYTTKAAYLSVHLTSLWAKTCKLLRFGSPLGPTTRRR